MREHILLDSVYTFKINKAVVKLLVTNVLWSCQLLHYITNVFFLLLVLTLLEFLKYGFCMIELNLSCV